MINVYISSPLSGNIERNLQNAVAFARYVLKECGAAPVVPHFYAKVLNDDDPAERKLALEADMSLLYLCQEVWVFGNYWTEGMKEEIKRARILNIPVRVFGKKKVQKILRKYGGNNDKRKKQIH